MVDLPKKKVGIVACSGEELPEGTVTRLAALKVLEELRPADTVTICLPLILQQFNQMGKPVDEKTGREMLEMAIIYNPLPAAKEASYASAILEAYTAYCAAHPQRREA